MSKDEEVESKEVADDAEEEINADTLTPQQQLYYFAKRGDVEGIKRIAKSVDVNAVDNEKLNEYSYVCNNTALHYAVQSGQLECVKVLYNLEAKLESTNKLKSTPLHIAASLGYAEIVNFLIDVKANIEAKNIVQNTPLHCAVYAGHVDTVQAMLSKFDEPRQALLDPNGVGMGAAKYTAHEDMKSLLRTYFPKKTNNDEHKQDDDTNGTKSQSNKPGYSSNDVQEEEEEQKPEQEQEEAPPTYESSNDNDKDNEDEDDGNNINTNPTDDNTYNPTDENVKNETNEKKKKKK
eukprot:366457_1